MRMPRRFIHRYVRMWAGTLLRIAGVTVTIKGQENIPKGRAVIFTPNHQGTTISPDVMCRRAACAGGEDRDDENSAGAHLDEASAGLRIYRPDPAVPWRLCGRRRRFCRLEEKRGGFPGGHTLEGRCYGEFKAGAFLRIACAPGRALYCLWPSTAA